MGEPARKLWTVDEFLEWENDEIESVTLDIVAHML